jgi:hypothetical protein
MTYHHDCTISDKRILNALNCSRPGVVDARDVERALRRRVYPGFTCLSVSMPPLDEADRRTADTGQALVQWLAQFTVRALCMASTGTWLESEHRCLVNSRRTAAWRSG